MKLRFPLTWFKWTMARSYAVWTDLRTLGFLPSINRSLSTVSSIPRGSSLLRGSHCLKEGQNGLNRTTSQNEFHPSRLNLTTFSSCQRRALRRAFLLPLFLSTRPVWAPPQEAPEWGYHCEEVLPGACLDQQSITAECGFIRSCLSTCVSRF